MKTPTTNLATGSKQLKAPRRASPAARRHVKTARQIEIRRALSATEATEALAAEEAVIAQCVSGYGRDIDSIARHSRNAKYGDLSSLQATHLFAERFAVRLSDPVWPWSTGPAWTVTTLADAPLEEFRHFWEGRVQADSLGMDYDLYIGAVAVSYAGLGFDVPPRPSDLQGGTALAVAALADVLDRARREHDPAASE
jgi:hypothetical protein